MVQLRMLRRFFVSFPLLDRETMAEWDSYNFEYNFKEKTTDWTSYLINMLPWIVLNWILDIYYASYARWWCRWGNEKCI